MNNLLLLPFTLLAGLMMGLLYFGGLWLTVRRLPTARNPVLLTLVSFLGRIGSVVVILGLILTRAQTDAPFHLLTCLVAFFWTRNRLIHRLQPRFSTKR